MEMTEDKKPKEEVLLDNIGKIAFSLDKAYLSSLATGYGVCVFDEVHRKDSVSVDYEDNIRAVKINRWMYKKGEKIGDCLKNVLSAFSDGDHTLAVVVNRTPQGTEMYFVIQNLGLGRNEDSKNNVVLLRDVIQGNFQGTQTRIIEKPDEIKSIFAFGDKKTKESDPLYSSVAVLTNTPSEFANDYMGQGLDKLLNGIVPNNEKDSYTIVFLAESLSREQIQEVISGYEEMATAIVPFLQYQFQMGASETETQGETRSLSSARSISDSIFKTHSINLGINSGINRSTGHSKSRSISASLGAIVGGSIGFIVSGGIGASIGANIGASIGGSISSSESSSEGSSKGSNIGYGYSWGETRTVTTGQTITDGTSSSMSLGSSESTTYTYKSYMVSNLLERLEKTMKRLNESAATGLWKYSAYILAYEASVSISVANFLRAITQGKESFIEPAAIQEWTRSTGNGTKVFDEIIKSVSYFCHPIFATTDMAVTATSYVATDQLSNVVAFPKKSVLGLPVLESVEFGREPKSLLPMDLTLEIGKGYDMRQIQERQTIRISKEELKKHTFITGSTGSGKSNTIYTLLHELAKTGVHFLVVEPAKGEYRQVLGRREGVTCYGTNPKITDVNMLHINPFSFPEGIHVLEHMDRLVEIFNVCWPMYAAMPAIMKDAIQRAYDAAGWDIVKSENRFDERLFPTFNDVLDKVREVLRTSDYSADNKGDYTGALVTRLNSLTNGIEGQIFSPDECPSEELFDRNVIVDLSRVGSAETKALIMGILVLKLQEYRMDAPTPNSLLHHVTVLEEAHNLLRRTSTEKSTDGANLLSKSVEMLANAIAEMRTYGEGFIIADQSPGLLDMSVIRNTNTKIIMRLPDFSDRELVGKAAGLTDEQIIEISKLEMGVASITQSDWLEPVLCKINKYKAEDHKHEKMGGSGDPCGNKPMPKVQNEDVVNSLLDLIMTKEIYREGDRVDVEKLRDAVVKSSIPTKVKKEFIKYISAEQATAVAALRSLVFEFFNADEAIDKSRQFDTIENWVHGVVDELKPSVKGYSDRQIDILMALIINEQVIRDKAYANILCSYTEFFQSQGGVY